jgi:hypothetical protein
MVWQVLKGDHVASGRCCIQLFMNSMSQEEALGHLVHAKVISCDYNVHMSKWFYDIFTGAATGAARCGSFVGGAQIARGVGYEGIA